MSCKFSFPRKYIQLSSSSKGVLARVVTHNKTNYSVMTEKCDLLAELSGKLRHETTNPVNLPVVGDYVIIDQDDNENIITIIEQVLPRKSLISRKAAGTGNKSQAIAANVDTIFICMSLNKDFNPRRIERYLSIAWDSGAKPVIILTKSDLANDIKDKLSQIEQIAIGVEIAITTNIDCESYKNLLKYLDSNQTVAFVGSSGAGKSTLINQLLGKDIIMTQNIDENDKGKHTTSSRHLYIIPNHGAVIDTPGMREIGLETANLETTFDDIFELAKQCKFNNCTHKSEPGCAVIEAINHREITKDRLASFNKLQKEISYSNLNSKQLEQEKTKNMFKDFGGIKNAKKFIKSKSKN